MKKINKINESNVYDNFLNLPPVESLGDGVYKGDIVGHCFSYNGNKYFCKIGIKGLSPCRINVIIDKGECKIHSITLINSNILN